MEGRTDTMIVKSVKRVVYSTCSIHPEEDEQVVMKALGSKEAKARGWTLAPRSEVLPAWERRGRPEEMGDNKGKAQVSRQTCMYPKRVVLNSTELAEGVIRCLPEDKTNGFFVACFIRGQPLSTTVTGKRAIEEEDEDMEGLSGASDEEEGPGPGKKGETSVSQVEKTKTAAQAERLRRKKQLQKKKRKVAQ